MKKLLIPAFALILAGAGCTMNQWKLGNGMTAYVNTPGSGLSEARCDQLLTLDQANALAGVEFTKRESSYLKSFDSTRCWFKATSGSASGTDLSVDASIGISKQATADSFDFWTGKDGVEPVEGLGDKAQWLSRLTELQILTGGVRFTVSSFTLGKEKLVEVAKVVLPRFEASDWGQEMKK